MVDPTIPAIKASSLERKSWDNFEKPLIERERTTGKAFCSTCAHFDFRNRSLLPIEEYFKMKNTGKNPIRDKKTGKQNGVEYNFECIYGHKKTVAYDKTVGDELKAIPSVEEAK